MHHIVTTPCILYQSTILDRHLHIILKTNKLKKIHGGPDHNRLNTLFWLIDLRYLDRKPDGFPIPNNNEIVGNIYWGESLAVVTYDFEGLNRMVHSCMDSLMES